MQQKGRNAVIIGVMGIRREMPSQFPVGMAENAGNMIHGNAPFEMFEGAYHAHEPYWNLTGASSFQEFVNRYADHLIVTMANSFRIGVQDGSRFRRLQDFLEKIETPITIFGLGIQGAEGSHGAEGDLHFELPVEAIDLMRFLGNRCKVVGVRGQVTSDAFRILAGVDNTYITGCPSLFPRPDELRSLEPNLDRIVGRPAFSGTKFHQTNEQTMLYKAIDAKAFIVEPVNARNHQFYVDASQGRVSSDSVPYFFSGYRRGDDPEIVRVDLAEQFSARYRLFRTAPSWYDFNREVVSYAYGTRFHCNMATLLSGKPALWITHDLRTSEMVELLHLPSISVDAAEELEPGDVIHLLDYSSFFEHIGSRFDHFNEYLAIQGLPEIPSVHFA